MQRCLKIRAVLLAGLCAATLAFSTVQADDDHERARRALEAGEVLSLRSVLEKVERDFPGEVIEVELEQEDGRWIYEIKLLRQGGGLLKLEIDARDATVLGVKGRDIRPGEGGGRR
ncbi:MAG TPA: PepSY domain-containing protein [Azoarcus taiwanensis]|nr:PepSY domain-containing protein [Azoarcus taiwanensis]